MNETGACEISSAENPPQGFITDSSVESDRIATEAVGEATRLLAALAIRRQCNQHQCTAASRMTDPNHTHHRRDVDYMSDMLKMLGLDDVPVVTAPEDRDELVRVIRQRGPSTRSLPLLFDNLEGKRIG